MQNAKELLPIAQYQPQWVIIAGIFIVIIIIWFFFVFYSTRHRVQKTIKTLKTKAVVPLDLSLLKKKYNAFISEIEVDAKQRRINVRVTHQKLSQVVRLFAFEASGFRAQVMTLADIERGKFPMLSKAISEYYPHEFKKISDGTTEQAITKAREVVATWQ